MRFRIGFWEPTWENYGWKIGETINVKKKQLLTIHTINNGHLWKNNRKHSWIIASWPDF